MVGMIKEGDRDNIQRAKKLLLETTNLSLRPIDYPTSLVAANLRARYSSRLKTADALQLAAAIVSKADYFLTNDRELAKLNITEVPIRLLGPV